MIPSKQCAVPPMGISSNVIWFPQDSVIVFSEQQLLTLPLGFVLDEIWWQLCPLLSIHPDSLYPVFIEYPF